MKDEEMGLQNEHGQNKKQLHQNQHLVEVVSTAILEVFLYFSRSCFKIYFSVLLQLFNLEVQSVKLLVYPVVDLIQGYSQSCLIFLVKRFLLPSLDDNGVLLACN